MADDDSKPAPGARGQLLTADQGGLVIMKSGARVVQLSKAGWIPRQPDGRFYLLDVVQGYIRFRDDEDRRASKSAASSRVSDARAREIELKNAQREGRLMEVADHLAAVDEIVATMLTGLSGLPARVTRDLQVRRDIEIGINAIRQEMADAAAKATSGYEAAARTDDTVSDHDRRPVGSKEPDTSE